MSFAANIESMSGSDASLSWVNTSGVWSYMTLPTGRLDFRGDRPVLILGVYLWLTGQGGSRSVRNYIANANGSGRVSSSAYSVPAGSAAVGRGYYGLAKVFSNSPAGAYCRVGATFNGATFVGRNAHSDRDIFTDSGANQWPNYVLAGAYQYALAPTFPRNPFASQVSPFAARLQWTTPSDHGGEAVTGYRIQYSLRSDFVGATSVDVGNIHDYTIQGLQSGQVYYFRVYAKNLVTTMAGTYSQASTTASVSMIAETGDLDAWEPFGELPAGVVASTLEGLRRSVIDSITGTPLALVRENNVLSGTATISAGQVGAQRTVTGLTPGKTYRLTATGAYYGDVVSSLPHDYQLGVIGLGWADPVALDVPNEPYNMPLYEFVATDVSHQVAVRLAGDGAAAPGYQGSFERFALWNLALSEIPSPSPYRVQDTVYESSLVNHFDLASNSVGGRWWVDAHGVTQFSANLGDPGALVTFTDARDEGKLEYVDIGTSYDTRNLVNDLVINNHGAKLEEDGWRADDFSWNYKDLTSVATWGPRAASVDMCLYDQGAYDGSIQTRAAEILSAPDPELTITWIKWNAQEAPDLASRLEIYTRVDVEFRGIIQPSRIVNIRHELTPKRWIMVLQLERL